MRITRQKHISWGKSFVIQTKFQNGYKILNTISTDPHISVTFSFDDKNGSELLSVQITSATENEKILSATYNAFVIAIINLQ